MPALLAWQHGPAHPHPNPQVLTAEVQVMVGAAKGCIFLVANPHSRPYPYPDTPSVFTVLVHVSSPWVRARLPARP